MPRKLNDLPLVTAVAIKFADLIWVRVGDDGRKQIQALNAAESDTRICHSHDFCDANEYMMDALESVHYLRGKPFNFNPEDEEQGKLIADAWEIAKRAGFDNNNIK